MKHGLAGNQGTGQAYHTGNLSQSEVRNASANNNFYANIGVNAGYSTSKNSNNSHNESAVVTTMKPMNENSSITYNNVNNITYQGTQAQGGTFIYNNVKNIRKEAVELHNSSSSRSSNFGISTGATIGYGYGTQITGNGGSVSANRSNLNTTETIYQNGNFQNVNEVHNNTGTMTLSGFNQEGGKVTGNIGKLVVESRQNTSTTTGRSSGASVGISSNGMPSSVNASGSRTNGNRAFIDNQSSFVVGEGSNLHVGTLENTGAVIGKQSDNSSTFKIDNYIAKNIYNEDTMTTTGGSIGASLGGKPRITSVGFNQDSRDKEGITRNTIVGNVEIQNASGDEINRDLSKANEITKDTHSSTNINVEPQVIEYISNPTKFKEDLEVAILEGKATGETVLKTIENLVNGGKEDIGDPERRTINEIKESIIRVKTAPEMNAIATGDLNSQEVLNRLNINAIEKFNPDDPDLPENVRARLDELAEDGKTIRAFYDKTTNKIFVNGNLTDDTEIRASVAREWKISEDLKTGKEKENDEGQLKSTVAGELAYDDMMKRAREGKTGSISTGELNEAVMNVDSEVSADGWIKDGIKWVKGTRVYKTAEKTVKWAGKQIDSLVDASARAIKNTGIVDASAFVTRTTTNLVVGGYNVTQNYLKKEGYKYKGYYHTITGNQKKAKESFQKSKASENNMVKEIRKTHQKITKDFQNTKNKIIQRNEPKQVENSKILPTVADFRKAEEREKLSEINKKVGISSRFKLERKSPYEALYIGNGMEKDHLKTEKGKYLYKLTENNLYKGKQEYKNLDIISFDPQGWERIENRTEYKSAVEETKNKGLNVAIAQLKSKDNSISGGFRIADSDQLLYPKMAESLEYALGSSTVTGTSIIEKKNIKGKVYLNISVRYQLSDEFKNPTGWGFEYGKPYNLMGPSKTDTVLRKTFNSNDEYLKFLKDYNIEENSKKR